MAEGAFGRRLMSHFALTRRKCAAGLDESGQLVASRGVGGGDHPPRGPAMSRVSEVLPLDSRSSVGRSGLIIGTTRPPAALGGLGDKAAAAWIDLPLDVQDVLVQVQIEVTRPDAR